MSSADLERALRAGRGALPAPGADVTRHARAAVVANARRRRRRMRTFLALAAALGVSAAVGFGAGWRLGPEPVHAAQPAGVRGAGFLPAAGWSTFQKGSSGGGVAIAANVRFDPSDLARTGMLPLGTLRSLPPRGVVLVASLATPRTSERAVQLRVSNAPRRTESVGGRKLLVHRLRTRIGAAAVGVSVFFGSHTPTVGVVGQAQRELDRLVVGAPRVTVRAERRQRAEKEWAEVSGTIASSTAGETVEVLARECGPKGGGFYRMIGGTRTVSGGSWMLETFRDGLPVPGIPVNAYFRARWDGALSEPFLLRVPMFAHAIWERRKRTVWALVASRPGGQNLARKWVELQRRIPGTDSWVRVRRARLQHAPAVWGIDAYRAAFPTRSRGITFRVFVPAATAAPCFLATATEPVTVP